MHTLGRFVIHAFSGAAVLLLVFQFLYKPLVAWDEWMAGVIMSAIAGFAFIAPREAFDVAKLSRIRAKALLELKKFLPEDQIGDLWTEKINAALHDPRYTLTKSIFDFMSWILGLGGAAYLLWVIR